MSELDHVALLRSIVERGASDLHLKAGSAPAYRIGGRLERSTGEAITAEQVARMAQALLKPEQQQALLRDGAVVGAHSASGIGRFRIAVYKQRGSAAIIVRAVADTIRPLEELGLPTAATQLAAQARGLVLVSSPVGSGATSTQASLVDHVNRHRSVHVVTVDDPIEVLHRDQVGMVSQLEVGSDVPTLAEGVQAATRLDSDVVSVSAIHDRETAAACLAAVARGCLVIGVIGGDTVRNAISAFLELFPFEERPIVVPTFARALEGVLVQRLLPSEQGGRVLAAEALVSTPKVEALLLDDSRYGELTGIMRDGVFNGMVTLDQSLLDLVRAGHLGEDAAVTLATEPEELRIELMRG